MKTTPVLLAEALEEMVARFEAIEGDNPEYCEVVLAPVRALLTQYRTAPGLDEAGARELLAAAYESAWPHIARAIREDHVVRRFEDSHAIRAIQKASRGEGTLHPQGNPHE